MAHNSPAGTMSVFFIPDVKLTDDETISTMQDFDKGSPDPINIYIDFLGFESESAMERFLSGGTFEEKTIDEHLEVRTKPLKMICAYVRNASNSSLLLQFRFSKNLCKYILPLTEGYGQLEINDRIKRWMPQIAGHGKEESGFGFSEENLLESIMMAVPKSPERVMADLPKTVEGGKKKAVYKGTKKWLEGMVENYEDAQMQVAINNLLKTMAELNADVLDSYNQDPKVRYNTATLKGKLTLNDIYYMQRRLLALAKKINKFQNGEFTTADDVIDFVNKNLVDASAIGEKTKFVINYPFQNLGFERRKQLLELFLDGRELFFSGFWAGASWNGTRHVSAGDIVFNLLSTATKEDIVNLVNKLDNDKKIFGLLNASSEDEFLFTISMILGDVKMSTTSIEKLVSTTPELLAKGNFIYFSMALSKNNYESLNENERKIYLSNGGHLILSDSPYDHLNELDYREKYASNKVFFDPLELVVLFAEDDIDTNIIKLKRGDSALLPACLVYLLFKEDTNRATSFLIAITTTVVFLPFGVAGLLTAIRTANSLGIIVGATDIAMDAAYLTYSSPAVQNSSLREDLEWINTAAAIYGLARLSYALKDFKGVQLLKDIKTVMNSLVKQGKLLVGSGGNLKYLKILSRKMAKQEERMSCAAACIREFAKDKGIILSESEIRNLAQTTEKGTSHEGIKTAMKNIFKDENIHAGCADHAVLSSEEIAKVLSKSDSWIAIVRPETGIRHTVIVDKIVDNKVYIRDPWPLEEFSKGFSGVEGIVDLKDFIQSWKRGERFFARISK